MNILTPTNTENNSKKLGSLEQFQSCSPDPCDCQSSSSSSSKSPYCPLCTSTTSSFPCTGVIGGGEHVGKFGVTGDIMYNLRLKDKSPPISICSSKSSNSPKESDLGWYNSAGGCGYTNTTSDITKDNNVNKMTVSPLTVGSKLAAKSENVIKENQKWSVFPLQSLHKIWGDGGNKEYNHGVSNRNVYCSGNPETVVFNRYDKNKTQSVNQQVIVMEVHGDNYRGDVPGLVKGEKPKKKAIPVCPTINEDLTKKNRVGGVVCTRGQFGPGVYNVLCYVPKTEDKKKDGRGYVFAIWPFHYEEIYIGGSKTVTGGPEPKGGGSLPNQLPKNSPDNSQARGNLNIGAKNPNTFPCYNSCDFDTPPDGYDKNCPPKHCNSDLYSVINHEIDIEIPCNSPQFDWKNNMTWNTMNCNTWLNDIDNYAENTGAYYTQVAVKKKKGDFISSEPEDSVKKDYHWYTIDWYVDNNNFKNNYVKFYFDDPFDPTGQTKDPSGLPLPQRPTGNKISDDSFSHGLVHSTQRFVPTRAGRLNVGPWMAWWGFNGKGGNTPDFDTAKVRMAQLSIIPTGQGYSFPQNYDQKISDNLSVECDFRDLYSLKPHPHPGPGPRPAPSGRKKIPWWIWIIIGILGLLLIVILGYKLATRKWGSRRENN